MKPSLTALTHLAFHINAMLDKCPDFDLSFAEVHHAAQIGHLVEHLAKRLRGHADLYLITSDPEQLAWLEVALGDAAECLRGRELGSTGVQNSGLCLVVAIILEAIQQQFNHRPSSGDSPEQPAEVPATE